MTTNPVLKPKLATPALILSSAAVTICVIYVVGSMAANGPATLILMLAASAAFLLAAKVGAIWFVRARRLRIWTAAADKKWQEFDDLKRTRGTTTAVTVLSVDALEPTGSWITIKWEHFDHIQSAWLEALNEPIWPGAVLLISPDPAQVRPGAPWPTIYYIQAASYLGWAPLAAKRPS
ncbi:hypothetical protein [Arthrobacter silvisoli]|uniref:hypothetical protein n=1 Tax=Arthrobacter silvisoli TaxID=2291022 RepID=UPI000E217D5A|nr:hypothetical protein [Arthrobacter silvisoli]